jgi:hypothetical protein
LDKKPNNTGGIVNQLEIVEVTLPNGQPILAQVHIAPGETGLRDVGLRDELSFSGVSATVKEVASNVLTALMSSLEKEKPNDVSIEFGVSLAVKSGRLTGLLIEGSSAATLKITLKWQTITKEHTASE